MPLSTLFSKTFSPHSSFNMNDQVSHPYKTIVVLDGWHNWTGSRNWLYRVFSPAENAADTRFSSENDGPILFYRPRDSIRIFGICRPPHSVALYTFWGLQPRTEELVVCIQHEQFWKT
jgi:hypothetical protein